MKKISLVMKSILALGVMVGLVLPLLAEAPLFINYQGKLTDGSGLPVGGNPNVIFYFYDLPSGGSRLYTAPTVTVTPQNGVFSCLIDISGKPDLFTSNQAVYLGVKVGTAPEFTERQRLVAAPYALSVAANKITPGNLPDTVIASSVAVDAVKTAQIEDLAVTDEKIVGMSANKLIGDVTATAYSGPVDVTQVQSGTLPSTVIASSVAVDAVKTAQIEDLAVTDEKVATGLDAGKITTGTLGDDRLSGAVTKLGNAVNAADGLLQLDSNGKVPTALWNNSIVNADIASGAAIEYGKLDLSGSIVKDDFKASELTAIYLTGDGRLIQGNVYTTAMCGVSAGSPLYYSCGSDACVESAPVTGCTSGTLVGNLVK